MGSRASLMPNNAYNIVLEKAGGDSAASGDFLYHAYGKPSYREGWWGIMRVTEPQKDGIVITSVKLVNVPPENPDPTGNLEVNGSTVVNAGTSSLVSTPADGVKVYLVDGPMVVDVPPDKVTGSVARGEWNWTFTSKMTYKSSELSKKQIRATSKGRADFTVPVITVPVIVPVPASMQLFPPSAPQVRAPALPAAKSMREMTKTEINEDRTLRFRKPPSRD